MEKTKPNKTIDYLNSSREKLRRLYDSQDQKLEKLKTKKALTDYQCKLYDAYTMQLRDIVSFLHDIDELFLLYIYNPSTNIELVNDINTFNNILSEADDYETSYKGKFAKITWSCKFPYRECYLVLMDNPDNLKRLKGNYLY